MEFPETGSEATTIRDPLVGAKVLGYEILRPIGVGGMGKVYEALERNIGRRAAVKVLLPEVADRPDFVARLRAEARAANAARHRGIVDIFGFTELPDGRHAIVMEYLDGVPLDEELFRLAAEGRRLPLLQTFQVLDQLAAVLTAAHAAGVIHRDLKPSNVFLVKEADGSTFIKVLDFGIAKHDVKASLKTATNMVMGTPHYMAPEQAAAQPAAPSMDIYAFGVIAFELFTGRLPFLHENVMSLLLAHQQETPPTPSNLNPSLPAVVDAFILRLLAKSPDERFASAQEVRAALTPLRRLLGDGEAMPTDPQLPASTPTVRVGETEALQRQAVRRVPAPLIAAVVAVGVMGALAFAALRDPPAPLPVAQPESTRPVAVVAPPEPVAPAAPEPQVPVAAPTPGPEPVAVKPPSFPTPKPQSDRRAALAKRGRSLQARLTRAEAAGGSFSLERQQLEKVLGALKQAPDARTLDQIEVTLQRLEKDLR